MSEVDLARLPRGEFGWLSLLEYVTSSDDRVERYFLEVKSDVDLNTKEGRAKVAKFVLGAANRDRDKASRRFDGYALMILGVGDGVAKGIAPFEAKDLAGDVQRLIGADGPAWDFERIPVDAVRDVIVVVVDPPTGDLWTCRADGAAGLADGSIYIRDDGSTRRATGDEIRQLVARATTARQRPISIAVDLIGAVAAIEVDEQRLINAIEDETVDLLRQIQASPTGHTTSAAILSRMAVSGDRRSKAEFRRQVEAWRSNAVQKPLEGVHGLAAHVVDGVRIRVVNNGRTYLRDVRVDIELDSPVLARDWEARYEQGETIVWFPGRPKDWGRETLMDFVLPRAQYGTVSASRHGRIYVTGDSPARVSMSLDDLRPEEEFVSDNDEIVLLICPSDGSSQQDATAPYVCGRWRMTAADVDDVFEGDFTVPIQHRDWREAVDKAISGEPVVPDGSA